MHLHLHLHLHLQIIKDNLGEKYEHLKRCQFFYYYSSIMVTNLMRRSPQEVALMIAAIFKRSGEKRARISEKTIKLLSKRVRLHSSFIVNLADEISNYNLYLIELDTGGFGIIPNKSLEGARSITARRYFDSDEMTHIRSGEMIDLSFLSDLKYEVESEASDEINEYE